MPGFILQYRIKRKRLRSRLTKLLSCTACRHHTPSHEVGVDVREEYANAFRTESYIDFWTRVLSLSNGESTTTCVPKESTTSARLPSYRLFAEHLLDPDQPTVTQILSLPRIRPVFHSLLSDYFTHTSNASLLFGCLLKDIHHTRVKFKSLKTILQSLTTNQMHSLNNLPLALTRLTEFSNFLNPFTSSASTPIRVQTIQSECFGLLKQLESRRDKVRSKLRLISRLKFGSAFFLVTLTASVTVIIVAHGFALLVAMPGLLAASLQVGSTKKLARASAQLDAAAKGTYILNKDLETISRLVARLNDELEHIQEMVKFWLKRGDDRIQSTGEVARQLKINDCSFSDQLDELEEHLYLCFMTINRARNLVIREVLNPGKLIQDQCY